MTEITILSIKKAQEEMPEFNVFEEVLTKDLIYWEDYWNFKRSMYTPLWDWLLANGYINPDVVF